MRNFSKYINGYKKEAVLGPLFKLCEAALELTVPLVVAKIIDVGIGNADKSYILWGSLFLVMLGAVGLAFSVTAQYFAAKASVGFVAKLRSSLFKHIQTLSYTEIDTLGTSTLITRMTSDANQVQTGMNLGLRLLLRSPFVVFGAMIMAFTIDTGSALTFAAAIPLLSIVVYGIMFISMPMYKKTQSRLDGVTAKTRENLSGVRVIRAFCREEAEIAEFGDRNEALATAQRRVGAISALTNPMTYVIINLATLALINVGAIKVDAGVLTQGMVIALYNYMSQILVELIKLANLIVTITKAVASFGRIQSIFDIKSSIVSGDATEGVDTKVSVEFSNVTFTYKNSGAPSLTDISFRAKKGDTIGIIGGTGSGKSSLVNLIPRFYDATGGVVLIDGRDVKTYDTEAMRQRIGVVPQRAVLFSGSVRENMRWGNPKASDDEIWSALRVAQAEDVVLDKGGLDFVIEEGGKNLSGGQKQRLTIARALVGNPDILILDDSASALDFATDAALRVAIREASADKTVFIVSQRASSIMHADTIIVLEDGEAVGIGKHDDLLATCPVYKEIYGTQFDGEVKR